MASVTIKDELYAGIKEYCGLNNLKIGEYCNSLLEKAFLVDKYGDAPPFFKKKTEAKSEAAKENLGEYPIVPEEALKPEAVIKNPEDKKTEEEKPAPNTSANSKKQEARNRIKYL